MTRLYSNMPCDKNLCVGQKISWELFSRNIVRSECLCMLRPNANLQIVYSSFDAAKKIVLEIYLEVVEKMLSSLNICCTSPLDFMISLRKFIHKRGVFKQL